MVWHAVVSLACVGSTSTSSIGPVVSSSTWLYRHTQHTLPDAKHSLITQACDQAAAELAGSHPFGHQITADNLPHGFTISDLVTQEDNHTVASMVSASTSHDFDTQPSSAEEEWNKVPGNRTSTSESGATRSRTASPARAAGVPTSNQYDA